MSYSTTRTSTFTVSDIATVMRRFKADLRMMAESTGGMSLSDADKYGDDVDVLVQNNALEQINVMLFSAGVKKNAVRYLVNANTGEITSSRPGGVIWPRLPSPDLQIVISYVPGGKDIKDGLLQSNKLKSSWSPSSLDISHSSLKKNGGRDYSSNGFGLNREDYS